MNELTPMPRQRRSRRRKTAVQPEVANELEQVVKEMEVQEATDLVAMLSKQVSQWFVRYKNQFHLVERLSTHLTQTDVKRVCVPRFQKRFPDLNLSENHEVLRDVFQRSLVEAHNDPEQTVPIWNGSTRCCPEVSQAIIREGETVAINTWKAPAYRQLGVVEANTSMLDLFLEKIFPQEIDRRVAKDWLAWCLQNEADKPSWALFLYSRRKGTGKSTFCHLAGRLFGEENSITQNSISKLTGRFNKPLLDSKLVISEELQLKPDSPHGNTLKTYITEKVTTSEAKGRDVEKVQQCCCFLFTTNHIPLWIEADERRYYVIDADHSGYASGPDAEQFGEFVGELSAWLAEDRNVATLYNGLMQHRVSNDFNPRSLHLSSIQTPVMKRIMGGTREVLLDRLAERLAGLGRFAIPQEMLAKVFIEELKTSQNRLRHMMPELGWRSKTVKWGGVDHKRTIWIHEDYQVVGGRVKGPNSYDEPVCPIEEEAKRL